MMNVYLLWAASLVSFTTFYVHTFIGGPRVAGPLLSTNSLPPASKWLNYYCWHMATVILFSMSIGYGYVAMNPNRPELAVFLTGLSLVFSLLSATIALKGKINPFRFPSTSLFMAIFLLGSSALAV